MGIMENKYKKGSEWRKWDLHVHTPDTKLNNKWYEIEKWKNKWNLFCEKIEKSDVDVFGITDYFSVENYFNFIEKFKKKYPDSKKIFFPNIELRLNSSTNNNWDEHDIHLIFDVNYKEEKKSLKTILNKFLSNLKLYSDDDQDRSEKANNLKAKKDFETACTTKELVEEALKDTFWTKKPYLVLPMLHWHWWLQPITRKVKIAEKLDKFSDMFFWCDEKDVEFWLNKRWSIDKKKAVITWSDLHSFDDFDKKIWKKFANNENETDKKKIRYTFPTWIKADPTFEWLKQIIYEPEERVFIWENKPTPNLNKIEEINLNFSKNIKIKTDWSDNKYSFCFSDVKENLYLSDYFNCFIWWRWSWKSSLLNLIYWNITWKKDTDFLDKTSFENLEINDDIKIDYKWEIEFLWQNKIEEFATDYVKFSKAIYQRLENQKELKKESNRLKEYIESLDEYIFNIQETEKNKRDLNDLEKRLLNYQSIVNIVKSDEYNELKKNFDNYKKEYYEIDISKEKYNKIKNGFVDFLNTFSKNDDSKNYYDKKYNDIFNDLKNIKEKIEKYDFSKIEENQKDLLKKEKQENIKLNKYLEKKGLSKEKLKNLEEAQEWLYKLKIEQENTNNKLQKCTDLLKIINIEEWRLIYNLYEHLIKKWLKEAEKDLNLINNENIKKFEFNIKFNIEEAKKDLLDYFIEYTFKDYKKSWLRSDVIKDSLFNEKIDINKILDGTLNYIDFSKYIKSLNWVNNDFLKNIFELESNFDIYKVLIAKYLYNLNNYIKIEILYDWRPIENSSFWQKCTVVILIMLLFWNKPIIIDEPEAHLDSSLIANYLVDLIKQRKKERQIIFATHNANFVINWDAEQIYILENNDNKTSFTQTTIENLDNRQKLLNLEWWKEAFWLRWKKYYWNN